MYPGCTSLLITACLLLLLLAQLAFLLRGFADASRVCQGAATAALSSRLVLSQSRSGWLNPLYARCVLLFLFFSLCGNLLLVDGGERAPYVLLPGLLLQVAGCAALVLAFSAPTRPTRLPDGTVDLFGRIREPSKVHSGTLRALRVPTRACWRGAPVAACAGGALAALAAGGALPGGAGNPAFTAVACLVVAAAAAAHRAFARVGYLAPLGTARGLLEASRDRRALAARAGGGSGAPAQHAATPLATAAAGLAAETRAAQWLAVAGVLCCAGAWAAAAGYRLGGGAGAPAAGPPRLAAQAAFLLLSGLGQALVAGSVPERAAAWKRAPLSLDDAAVCPLPTSSRPLSVLMVLPAAPAEWDAVEAAVPFFMLTRRGHRVTFAVSSGGGGGERAPPGLHRPAAASVWGYQPCGGGCCCCCAREGGGVGALGRLEGLPCLGEGGGGEGGGEPPPTPPAPSRGSRRGGGGGGAPPPAPSKGAAPAHRRHRAATTCLPPPLACSPWEECRSAGLGGAGSALVGAMVMDLFASAALAAPLSLEEALGRGLGGVARGGGVPDAVRAGGGATAGAGATPPPARLAPPPAVFDGLVLLSARGGRLFGGPPPPPALSELLRAFWGAGLPCALYGDAALIAVGAGGLLAGRRSAAPSPAQVVGGALLEAGCRCAWRPLRTLAAGRGGGGGAPAGAVAAACGSAALVATALGCEDAVDPAAQRGGGDSVARHAVAWLGSGEVTLPGLRAALPAADSGGWVVADGHYISAQCGGDAFALSRALIDRLESTATTY